MPGKLLYSSEADCDMFNLIKLNENRFATAGKCCHLKIWDSNSNKENCLFTILNKAHSIALKLNKFQFVTLPCCRIPVMSHDNTDYSIYYKIKVWDINTFELVLQSDHFSYYTYRSNLDNLFKMSDFELVYWTRESETQCILRTWNTKNLKPQLFLLNLKINCIIKISNELLAIGTNDNIEITNINNMESIFQIESPAYNLLKFNNFKLVSRNEKEFNIWNQKTDKTLQTIPVESKEKYVLNKSTNIMIRLNEFQLLASTSDSKLEIINI